MTVIKESKWISKITQKDNIEIILFIMSLSVAFSSEIGNLNINNKITHSILLIWIIRAGFKFKKNGYCIKNKGLSNLLYTFIKYNFYPKVIIYIYTIVLIIFRLTEKRFLSTNIQTFVNAISAIAIICLYEKKAFEYSMKALFLSYIYAVFGSIWLYGIEFINYLEFHDMAFGTGYVIIYFFMTNKKLSKKDLKYVIFSLILVLLAYKRIELGALALVYLFYLILKKFTVEQRKIIIKITGTLFIIVCFAYIYVIFNGVIWEWFNMLGIEVSGRNYYYQAVVDISEFSPFFWGYGRNSMATIFTNELSFMNVGNLHSDILRMYAECGFILFGLWLWVYLYRMPSVVEEKFGYNSMECLFICTLYTFIVYFTDNTELYLINQYFYMLIPIYYILTSKSENDEVKFN